VLSTLNQMKAIVLKQPGDATNLAIQDVPKPVIQEGEVLALDAFVVRVVRDHV